MAYCVKISWLIGSSGKQYIVYEECGFTGKIYFKHRGSQNETLKEAKRKILRDMHVKELIQSNHSER